MDELVPALRIERAGVAREVGFHRAGQGVVHVVAAQHEVVAHGEPVELERAVLVALDADDRKVRRPAAHVADEDERAVLELVLELVAGGGVGVQPGVERGERFLKQHDGGQTGALGGLDGQLASHLVERGGDGEDEGLRLQRMFGVGGVPGLAKVREVARRGFDGRDLLDVVGRAPGEDGRGAVDLRVAEPRLRRGHEPPRHAGALRLRKSAHRVGAIRRPGERGRPVGEFVRARQIQK